MKYLFLFFMPIMIYSQNFIGQSSDVGKVNIKGESLYDSIKNAYVVTGSGENIWGNEDAFHFVWEKVEGDIFMETDIEWIGEGKHPHRKGGLMFRAGLSENDPYVDIVVHGDGLISMQFRKEKGGETSEIKSNVKPPVKLMLEKNADQYTASLLKGSIIYPVGTISLNLSDSLYAGIVVCSHDSTVSEKAVFRNVNIKFQKPLNRERKVESTIEIFDLETRARKVFYRSREHFEAPNWSPDNKFIYFNKEGKIYRIALDGKIPEAVNTDFAVHCNNDHGLSADGKMLAISNHDKDGLSRIYVLPGDGGIPQLVTRKGPSYWHGWSPDSKYLVYCAERNGNFDIYKIDIDGKNEIRLTYAEGLDDGPEFSPDGKYIYFNSERTGKMKIWRMDADGGNQTQITADEFNDWFPHPSPDNKYIVFLSYAPDVTGHPPNKNVLLRLMNLQDGSIETLAELFGGQGTINVPSWSPDGKKFAFVSYRLIY
jgi:Tol biopolymer transport system component